MRTACLLALMMLVASGVADAAVRVWVPDALKKILPGVEPPATPRMSAELSAARGEWESIQVAVRADEPVEGVTAEISPLRSEAGAIDGEDVSVNVVGLVPVAENTEATPIEELIEAPAEIPDPLLPYEPLDLQPGRTRCFWFTVHVPRDADPGRYSGVITIGAGEAVAIPVSLTVHPITLPEHRPLHMTNWFSARALATWYELESWSEEHWEMIARYARDMAEHGEDTIIVGLNMIGIWQEADGTLSFDFQRFDRYIDTFREAGVDQQIELGHVGGRGEGGWSAPEMVFRDWNVQVREGAEPVELSKEQVTGALVHATQEHLRERGLLQQAMIHIADEPIPVNLDSWIEKSRIVHEAAPELRRIDAIHVRDCRGELEIYCPELGYFDRWHEHYAQMQRDGLIELWFYTCCNPKGRYANRFIDQPLIKTRLLHWMNYLYDARGYLHWGPNRWHENPFEDPVRGDLPPGDAWLVYPGEDGPLSSVRWEAVRDGVEDFELLWLLEQRQRDAAQQLGLSPDGWVAAAAGKRIGRRLIRTLTDYTDDPAELRLARERLFTAIREASEAPLLVARVAPQPEGYVAPGPVTVEGAVEEGATVSINGRDMEPDARGRFQATVELSRDEPTVTVTATLRRGRKRLEWTWQVADEQAVLLQRAIDEAEAAAVDCSRGREALDEHLAALEAGAPERVAQSRETVAVVIDELRAMELNARIEALPDEAREADAWQRLMDAKRLKDYEAAKGLLEELSAAGE